MAVLWLTNDMCSPFSKTSEYLAAACERIGQPALIRDTADARLLVLAHEQDHDQEFLDLARTQIVQRYEQLIHDFAIDTVASLDLNWLFIPGLFTETPGIRNILTLWFDDFRAWCTGGYNLLFPLGQTGFQDLARHPHVLHCFYGHSLAREAALLGYHRQCLSHLAAPVEFTQASAPPEILDRACFIGNPGFRGQPPAPILQRMEQGATLRELRALCRQAVLNNQEGKWMGWIKEEPSVAQLMAVATQAKVENPYEAALLILELAGTHYPRAFAYLNERGSILDAAFFVKLVNWCERPAVIRHLWSRGLLDVYSNPDEWQNFGVTARPYIRFNELPIYYQKYLVHVNAANCVRDATANEKLFEIAACARVSINIDSPDVRACYAPDEVALASDLSEVEECLRHLLAHPHEARQRGERARIRTQAQHLWDHRINALLHPSGICSALPFQSKNGNGTLSVCA